MKKAYYDHKPKKYEAVGNGSYLYRWDIEEVEVETIDITIKQWTCYEVTVWESVTNAKLTKTVIDAMWGDGVEEKLINDYNAVMLGVLDEGYINRYKEFIVERKRIKEQIDADCAIFNIK